MIRLHRMPLTSLIVSGAVAMWAVPLAAQVPGPGVPLPGQYPTLQRLPNIEPLNDLPDPYESSETWATLPDGREWGSTAGVDIDPDGMHLWAIDRCGGNSCADSDLDPLLKIDPDGNVVESFGGGMILFPHGLHVDYEGNVWVTDAQGPNPDNPNTAGKGHAVYKFSPTGEHLLTLGVPGIEGDGTDHHLRTPCDVVVDENGFIYVGDGHSGQGLSADPDEVARIAVFDSDGNYVRSWGRLGSGPGELRTPHGVDIDAHGRLVVADRGNNRLQIFELDGTYVGELRQFGRPSGIYITDDNMIYVADSESEFGTSQNPGWVTGIRAGSLDSGIAQYHIHGASSSYPDGSNPEGVAVDASGNVYGAVVSGGGAMVRSVPDME